jgi:hypothetical protein
MTAARPATEEKVMRESLVIFSEVTKVHPQ